MPDLRVHRFNDPLTIPLHVSDQAFKYSMIIIIISRSDNIMSVSWNISDPAWFLGQVFSVLHIIIGRSDGFEYHPGNLILVVIH